MTDSLRQLKNLSIVEGLGKRVDQLENCLESVPLLLSELARCVDKFSKLNVDLASCFHTIFADTTLEKWALRFKQAQEDALSATNHFIDIASSKSLEGITDTVLKLGTRRESYSSALQEFKKCHKSFDSMCKDRRYSPKVLEASQQALSRASGQCNKEDGELTELLDDLDTATLEIGGPVFFTFVQGQCNLLQYLCSGVAPFGCSSEAGKLLTTPPTNAGFNRASTQWLSVHHSLPQLRYSDGLDSTDLKALVRCKQDGLAATSQLKLQLNTKLDTLLQNYLKQLKASSPVCCDLPGGFQYKPIVIQTMLKECCTDAEARAAGAPLPYSEPDRHAQIMRDVPHTVLKIASRVFDSARTNREKQANVKANVKDKQEAVYDLVSNLSGDVISSEALQAFSHRVLLELCSSITLMASRTAVQLLFGKANLVAVCPSQNPDDVRPVEVLSASECSVKIVTQSTWWLVEDYMMLWPLKAPPKPLVPLGTVDVTYTQELNLEDFMENSGQLELPMISVAYHSSSSPEEYSPIVGDSKSLLFRGWTKLNGGSGDMIQEDPRGSLEEDNKSDYSAKTGSTVRSRDRYKNSYGGKPLKSKSSYSALGITDNNYLSHDGSESGTTETLTVPAPEDEFQSLLFKSSSYLNPSRLKAHTQVEAEKAAQGYKTTPSWKKRPKLPKEPVGFSKDSGDQQLPPYLRGMNDGTDYLRIGRHFNDQNWSNSSSQEEAIESSNSSLNELEQQISRSRGSSFHSDHHHQHDDFNERSVHRSSRESSLKKHHDESRISVDSGITSSINSQDAPSTEYKATGTDRTGRTHGVGNFSMGSYYDSNKPSYDRLPKNDSSSDEREAGYSDSDLEYRIQAADQEWQKILSQSDTEPDDPPHAPKPVSTENVFDLLDANRPHRYDSTQSLNAAFEASRHMGVRSAKPYITHSLSQDTPGPIHTRQMSGEYMFHSQESLEGYHFDDQGLPPRSMVGPPGGYDRFAPPQPPLMNDFQQMSRPHPPRHNKFSPSPGPPMEGPPGISPQKMLPPFHGGGGSNIPPGHWPNHIPPPPMMNHHVPPSGHHGMPPPPPHWEHQQQQPPGGFRPIHGGYESPSPGPSPGPSPRPTPPPTPPPPNHIMGPPPPMHPGMVPPHHRGRPQSAPANRIPPMSMLHQRPPLPPHFWEQNNSQLPPHPHMGPPRGPYGPPHQGPPPQHMPPGRFGPPDGRMGMDKDDQFYQHY